MDVTSIIWSVKVERIMCGIAGIFNLNREPVSPVGLRRMTDAIAHRGPDGEGLFIDRFIGLGHRRLAIIDLSPAGHQPMQDNAGDYIISYNGEVYNFKELRLELEQSGHRFRSRTDTEVVLASYIEWGKECVNHFNGMFAFAIWDRKNQTLFLARDRYGIKPLYYAFIGNAFLFASEQKAIMTHPDFSKELDDEALLEYLTFQNLFTDRTLLKRVQLFPPAHYGEVRCDADSHALRLKQYWDFDFREPSSYSSEEEYEEELERLFTQAVKRQLISDVGVGAYLSGGMDSGSITAITAKEIPYVKTFTCGFDLHSASGLELGFDERERAEYMSYLFRTEHYEMVLKAGDMERIMPKLVWHVEEPRVGQCYPNFYVSQLASKFTKVVLSGGGGDEMFGGYPWRYYNAAVCRDFEDYIDKYYSYWQRLAPNTVLKNLLSPISDKTQNVLTRDIFKSVFSRRSQAPCSTEEYINHSLYFEARTFLHGILVIEDKISSAHSLETRLPFLDNDLVDFAMRIPVKLKIKNHNQGIRINENDPGNKKSAYVQKYCDGKNILRSVMQRHIPTQITSAHKQGFSAPDATWFKGDSMEYVRNTLMNKSARIHELMDKTVLFSLLEEHLSGLQNRRLLIWSLLYLEEYMNRIGV